MTPDPESRPPAPGRVRVTAPRRQGRHMPFSTSVSEEVAEQSAVGEVMVRSLIRSQLRLALAFAGGFLLVMAAIWVAVDTVSELTEWEILGVPVPWLLLGVGVYPIIGLCAWLYVRAASKNENRYRDLVEGK
ncbi:hypothetical protein AL755_07075 [Arthrobacter sp. ERGS1:01]|uniref:hypothetical protein n=1 Tax=Arthrobacter sp. ERGS1:01 TaxID=1704044 RepID=UPI0006B495CB|nr:hypothetical protein [Arthrobacter sp. ERGS1:01]ALE05287.1 hypothetical protein AL755_07075 [Arthrobacter sp. ERGS1:01]